MERPLAPLTGLQQGVLALGSVAMGVGMAINFVVAAPLAREAGLSVVQVAGVLTGSTLIYSLAIPYWARLAERVGRKPVMVFSLLAMAGANMLFLFALKTALAGLVTGVAAFLMLAGARLFFGLLSPGLQPASMAAMADATTSVNRAAGLGLLGAAMGVGSVLGPAGAAIFAQFGALAPIWASIAFSAATALIVAAILPGGRPSESRRRPKPLSLRDPRIAPHLVFLVAYFVGVGMVQQTLAFLVQDRYGLERADAVSGAGLAFAVLAVVSVVVQFGYVRPRNPAPRGMLIGGLLAAGVGYAGVAIVQPYWAVCACFGLVGIGGGLAVPAANALGSLAVARGDQGAAAALMSTAPPAGFIIGPLVGALLYTVAPEAPFLASGVLILGLLAFALRMRPGGAR